MEISRSMMERKKSTMTWRQQMVICLEKMTRMMERMKGKPTMPAGLAAIKQQNHLALFLQRNRL